MDDKVVLLDEVLLLSLLGRPLLKVFYFLHLTSECLGAFGVFQTLEGRVHYFFLSSLLSNPRESRLFHLFLHLLSDVLFLIESHHLILFADLRR